MPEAESDQARRELALEHLDLVDVASDDARVPGRGETGDDGIAVTVDAHGEGVQAGEVVLPNGVDPLLQPFALELGEHLAEGPGVNGEGIEFGAVDQDSLEPKAAGLCAQGRAVRIIRGTTSRAT
ncbi:hypothetical protein [Streptomyces sp. enrichment culture]|uniref:hypothetical protein n=1 Tax=Streptomyces sp. enrichment culture TaxID=1795815 RepID=UPI003F560748